MFPGVNPKQMQGMLKKMGISQEDIDASRVIIEKTDNSRIIIENPSVQKVKMQGQETFQISGDVHDESLYPEEYEEEFKISEEDIKTVMEKTGVSEEIALEALKKNDGDLAEAILELSK
jgi:nascent polypeptide-associated complex subunit alpha